jgi:5-methylcytosine-specific restriction endonuclease McrA
VPTRLCSEPTCASPATYRGRCAEHARTTNRETHRNRVVYASSRWKYLRRAVLSEQPLCACGCGRLSEDIDHITPIDAGGGAYDRTNLQGLTHACHSAKTRKEQAWPPTQ